MNRELKRLWSGLLAALLAATFGVHAASATTTYPDVPGVNVNFTGIQETNDDDPLGNSPLFGAPGVVGDQLEFSPTSFSTTSTGGGTTKVGAKLETMIEATGLAVIEEILIEEFGDIDLADIGNSGTAATGGFIQMTGVVLVVEANGASIPTVEIQFAGVFSPNANGFFFLPGDDGVTLWSGSASIDVASAVPNATKVILELDNDLTAASELGTTSIIQKKFVNGPAIRIAIIPEPGTSLLLGGGLLGLALRAHRRRN